MATIVTLSIDNLDRTVHALLIAKADYLTTALENNCSRARWEHVKESIEALDALYDDLNAALALVEG